MPQHGTRRPVRLRRIAAGLTVALGLALGFTVGAATAQIGTPPAIDTPHVEHSGVHDNTTDAHRMVWQTLVHVQDADWIQVNLSSYSLPGRATWS